MENRETLIDRACPLCGRKRYRTFLVENRVRYVRCACGHVYQNPHLSLPSLMNHYQEYHPEKDPAIGSVRRSMEPVFQEACRMLQHTFPSPGSILDIGCGHGFFMDMMKRLGWKVMGCDPSQGAARYARKRWDMPVDTTPFEFLELQPSSLDAVTGFYVIEHVLDPAETLQKIHRLLKPGGMVLLRFPHTAPIARWGRLLGRSDMFHAPWHLSDFSQQQMTELLSHCGFERIRFMTGGYTRPDYALGRWASRITARVFSLLDRPGHGRWLPPGISRTVTAVTPAAGTRSTPPQTNLGQIPHTVQQLD